MNEQVKCSVAKGFDRTIIFTRKAGGAPKNSTANGLEGCFPAIVQLRSYYSHARMIQWYRKRSAILDLDLWRYNQMDCFWNNQQLKIAATTYTI